MIAILRMIMRMTLHAFRLFVATIITESRKKGKYEEKGREKINNTGLRW